MIWMDIACIVFACVTMNHLGLVSAVEKLVERTLWVVNCPKCITMWSVFAYGLLKLGFLNMPHVLAVSLLSSYMAIWLELLEAYIDKVYIKLYDKICSKSKDEPVTPGSERADT